MEDAFIAEAGRGWLANAEWARTHMVSYVTPTNRNLIWFDLKMICHIAAAVCILCSTISGAFVISCMKHNLQRLLVTQLTTSRLYTNSWPWLQIWWVHDLCYSRYLGLRIRIPVVVAQGFLPGQATFAEAYHS